MSKVNKFRMWDKRLNKMAFTGFHLVGEVTAFGGMSHWIEETRHLTPECKSSTERWDDFIEMQWTGLKDKNGVDIYEGDVVKFYTSYYTKGKTSPVDWCEEGMWMPFRDPSYVEDEQGDWFDYKQGFEVIGHIYEEKK